MTSFSKVSGSFRDPNGFLFFKDGILYRQINFIYKPDYTLLMNSGLYNELTKSGWLVSHKEVEVEFFNKKIGYKIIKPLIIPFISYPYEWTFSQLKDAAILTLNIMEKALDYGMILKDASGYNVQFMGSKPIFIDTLSFAKYQEGMTWAGYRQFCQHFLAPLALMAYTDDRLNSLLRSYIDGIPLDLADSLLPLKSKLKLGIMIHLSLHAKAQKMYSGKGLSKENVKRSLSLLQLKGIIKSLKKIITKLSQSKRKTEWSNYYSGNCNYTDISFDHKKKLVKLYLKETHPKMVWDLGANDGSFSDLASDQNIFTVAFDIDPSCVERNYLRQVARKGAYQLPLLIDLTNPSPDLGWSCNERMSFMRRGSADLVLALALVHHLAISNNVPLKDLALFFSKICRYLIIEFVPKEDPQVMRLLASRVDIFTEYNIDSFEKVFRDFFKIRSKEKINNSLRTIYLMEKLPEDHHDK